MLVAVDADLALMRKFLSTTCELEFRYDSLVLGCNCIALRMKDVKMQ